MTKYPDFILKLIDESSRENIILIDECCDTNNNRHRYSITFKLTADQTLDSKKTLIVIMMNPSAADKEKSDNSVNRLLKYAKCNDYTELIVLNSLSIYLTNSSKLTNDMIKKENFEKNIEIIDNTISELTNKNYEIIIATGNPVISKGKKSICKIYEVLNTKCVVCKRFSTDLTKMGYTKHLRVTKKEVLGEPLVPLCINGLSL